MVQGERIAPIATSSILYRVTGMSYPGPELIHIKEEQLQKHRQAKPNRLLYTSQYWNPKQKLGNPKILKIKTLDHLENQYPKTQWIHAFIDRSSKEAVRRDGAGIQILMPSSHKIKKSVATWELSTNY